MFNAYWFIGEVVDITGDPEKLGRVRVKIYQDHDLLMKNEDLTWSHVMLPTTSESLDGIGMNPSLAIGSRVIGFHPDGENGRVSIIIGTMLFNPSTDTGSSDHSLSFLSRGRNSINQEKIGLEQPESSYKAEYPYNRVLQTKSGHVIEVDDTAGEERIHIRHKAGSFIEINKDGRITIVAKDDSINITGGNNSIQVKGNASVLVEGNLNATVGADANITSGGNLYIGAVGNLELSSGNSIVLSSASGVTIRAPGGLVSTSSISAIGTISSAVGATGTFTSVTGKIVSVNKGLVSQIKSP